MITYHKGDLLKSMCNFICHQVNCNPGVMGAGIAKQIKDVFPEVYSAYKKALNEKGSEGCFGTVLFVPVTHEITVANMFSQFDVYPRNVVHTDYDAFRKCCNSIKQLVFNLWGTGTSNCRIGFPYKIGCGLAGGDWSIISQILEEEFAGPHWNIEIWEYTPQKYVI